jgi:hypothetical protein
MYDKAANSVRFRAHYDYYMTYIAQCSMTSWFGWIIVAKIGQHVQVYCYKEAAVVPSWQKLRIKL